MTIKRALASLRRYGLRGIVDFIKRMPDKNAFSRKMAKTLIDKPNWKPQPGITVIGPLSQPGSLYKTLRDFVIRLHDSDIPCQTFDTTDKDHRIPESEYEGLLTQRSEFRLDRYTDIVGMFSLPSLPPTACRLSRIGFWEFESGLCEGKPEVLEPIDVIAMSDFNLKTFREQLPSTTAVYKILYPFQFTSHCSIPSTTIRERFGLSPDDFVVFFNFSFGSGYKRKNPDGLIRAFAEGLGDRAEAKLVFKTMNAKLCTEFVSQLKGLAHELGISSRLTLIDDYLTTDEIIALTDACDVYASLHRGEGFGLGIAEAMSLGKPVVVTGCSAPTEFCRSDNAMLVPYVMRSFKSEEIDRPWLLHVKEWPDPDIHAAAMALRRLYDDRAFTKQLGENGRRFIADHFSDANFKKSVEAFLNRS